ncbi:MAG: 8-oxo-dGTP diphosphatase [Patescibacteria group bacterium]
MHFPNKATICYLIDSEGRLLLQKKSKGFGKGKWNGPGGKIEKGETPKECVQREVKEETGIEVLKVESRGELEFIFPHKPEDNFYCYVFVARDFQGEPEDKGEGELKWFKKEELPLSRMWDDDRYWLLEMLEGNFVRKRFYFDKNNSVQSHYDIKQNRSLQQGGKNEQC